MGNLMRGAGKLHHLPADPALRDVHGEMLEELLRWTIRTEDDLPEGRYPPRRAARNWHAGSDF